MIVTTGQPDADLAAFERIYAQVSADRPGWFDQQRRRAFARFVELGLPTSKCEDWRSTNITPLRRTQFVAPGADTPVSEQDLAPFEIHRLRDFRLVFVHGRYHAGLSRLPDLDCGVEVLTLAQAFTSNRPLLEAHLARQTDSPAQAFTALNTALAEDGLVVVVKRGQTLAAPLRIVQLTPATDQPTLVNVRNLIVAEAGAGATIVEDHLALRRDVSFTNAVTEMVVGENARVSHYLLQRGSTRAFHVSALHVHQQRDSQFAAHCVLLGGRLVRNNVYPVLDGTGCQSLLNGLYVLDGDESADNHMRVDHAQPHCHSQQFYKGIMNGKSRGVFRGRIIVRPDAQKTDAKQSNQNLLLSDDAGAHTDPQLEIYADDVRCTHGATVGRVDENQVFYLMSRGLSEATARAMITHAFAAESLQRMDSEPIREMLRCTLATRLPDAKVREWA